MKYTLYILALLLITGWIIGFVVYTAGAIVHLLLAVAGISILVAMSHTNNKKVRKRRETGVVKS